MEELIKITERRGKSVVSAKELYDFLGYDKSQWSRWYQSNIINNEFSIEGVDYQPIDIVSNGNKTKEFAISIDFAKELSMLARTEKGKQARLYFISCEKKIKEMNKPSYLIDNKIERAKRWIKEQEELQQAQLDVKDANEHINRLVHNGKPYTSSEIAKELNIKSATVLNKILSSKGIQYKQNGTWLLYSKYADKGLVSIKQSVLDSGRIIYDRQWTGKGRDYIINLLSK